MTRHYDGTSDLWADGVHALPTEVRGDEIWVEIAPHADASAYLRQRLQDALERNLSLVTAKSVFGLMGCKHPFSGREGESVRYPRGIILMTALCHSRGLFASGPDVPGR
jgi:hypothetical protein